MNHAVTAGLMVAFALFLTFCTANVVQTWAIARQPQSSFVPPPTPNAERRADKPAGANAKTSNDRKPVERGQSTPGISPTQQTPRN